MKTTPRAQHNPETSPSHEPDVLPVHKLAIWVGALVVLVAAVVIGMWQLFQQAVDRELLTKDLAKPSVALQEVRARDDRLLNTYAVVDTQKGLVRIPVARAMEVLVHNPKLLAPVPTAKPPASTTTPDPTPPTPPADKMAPTDQTVPANTGAATKTKPAKISPTDTTKPAGSNPPDTGSPADIARPAAQATSKPPASPEPAP